MIIAVLPTGRSHLDRRVIGRSGEERSCRATTSFNATSFPLLLMLLLLPLLLTQRWGPTDPVGAAVAMVSRLDRRVTGRRGEVLL